MRIVGKPFYLNISKVKDRTYARLAHSVRSGTRVKTVVLVSLGAVSEEQVIELRKWMKDFPLTDGQNRKKNHRHDHNDGEDRKENGDDPATDSTND